MNTEQSAVKNSYGEKINTNMFLRDIVGGGAQQKIPKYWAKK